MELERIRHPNGVTLVGGASGRVHLAFTERTGGVSKAPYESLNLGTHVGDDPVVVAENRRRVLAALGVERGPEGRHEHDGLPARGERRAQARLDHGCEPGLV